LVEQQLILETVMKGEGKYELNVKELKQAALELAKQIKDVNDEAGFDKAEEDLFKRYSTPAKSRSEDTAEKNPPANPPAAPPAGGAAPAKETTNAKS
jgi:hypothetical protein